MGTKSSTSLSSRNFSVKQHWTQFELNHTWQLSQEEKAQALRKTDSLVYGIKMKYFMHHGYFPSNEEDIPDTIKNSIARQLGVNPKIRITYEWKGRLARLHHGEIRKFYGFRKPEKQDWYELFAFIENCLWIQALPLASVYHKTAHFFTSQKIAISAISELEKKVDTFWYHLEQNFFQQCDQHLQDKNLQHLLDIQEGKEDAPLTRLRKPAGKAAHPTIVEELAKLSFTMPILQCSFFETVPKKVIKKYYEMVMVQSPSHLRVMDVLKSKALLACFCYYKGSHILDGLLHILIKRFTKIENLSHAKAKEELWQFYVKQDNACLFNKIVDISLEHPTGIIQDKIYKGVGGQEILKKSKASRKPSRQVCKELDYKHLSSFYVHHHRSDILAILKQARLGSHTHPALVEAVQAILENKVPDLTKIASKAIRNMAKDNPIYCELAILTVLKKALKCKNVWSHNAWQYNDPEKCLPPDFDQKKSIYCQILNLPEDVKILEQRVKSEMTEHIRLFNSNIINDTSVRIGRKSGKPHIFVTPYKAQDEPQNIHMIKESIRKIWPDTPLLDIWKEVDLRLGLTQELIDITDSKIAIDHDILRQRLLLCIFAIGTNTEFRQVCAGIPHISEDDLHYVKKRFLSIEGMRHIIKKLVDGTLAIREKDIWGEMITHFASDAMKMAVWSNNIMSEYHVRYQGDGIMAYWHMDKKALCICGQIKRCSDSEIAAMLYGVLHHGTQAKVGKHSTDTHGQSLIAFAITYLLGIELRPRIKGIGRMRLYKPDTSFPKSYYENIAPVITRGIYWSNFVKYYDQILRYLVAFTLRPDETEILLTRFLSANKNNTIYEAFREFGRAICTIAMCRNLGIEAVRIEDGEVLNVVENWNSGTHFIFHGKRGVISSNDERDQELAVLCLHLLQSSLVYINTLMLQECIRKGKIVLTIEDKRAITPLFEIHINQYGLLTLDMNKRLNIEEIA